MGKNIYILTLLLIIASAVAWYFFIREDPVPEQVTMYEYTTDTIFVQVPYEVPVPYSVPTPPLTVTIYKVDSAAIQGLRLIIADQELKITGLKDTISLHENYIKQYPRNPKFLSMELNRDSLNLGLLQISGQIEERSWPIDLNAWSYNWNFDSDLSRHATQPPPIKKPELFQLLIGGGADLLASSSYGSLRAEFHIKKFRIYSDANLLFKIPEASNVRVGLEYKIYGR